MGFYGQLARYGSGLCRDEDFRSAYCCTNGRPSAPPSVLALARVLQFYDGVSDEEVVQCCRFDLRWKVALDLELYSTRAPFAKSTFQAFRVRLTLHAKEGLAFEKSIQAARDAGLLPQRLHVALDSSPVRGRGAVKDTCNLLSDAIAAVVRAVAKKQTKTVEVVASQTGLARHVAAPSVQGSEVVDWNDQSSVGSFLRGLLDDCEKAAALARIAECASEELALLEKVIAQDVERGQDGTPRIRQGVTPGRTVSVHDPESRHGHKSNGKVYTGHKAHVAVDTGSGMVTAITVTAPSGSEGSQVHALVEMTETLAESEIEGALGDSAYSTRAALAAAAAELITLSTKMPGPPHGKLGPNDFTVSDDGQAARCPAGNSSCKVGRSKDSFVHSWDPRLCSSCPLRERCTKARARTLMVPPDFHARRARERFAHSPEGRALLRTRVAVEHAIGRLKNLGAGVARYCGRAKTHAQWLWTAAVANLMLVWSRKSECPA
jgi:transposase